jgi:hypothetical protein
METETPLHHWNEKQLIYDSSGVQLPDEKADKLSSLLWKIIGEAFEVSAAATKRDGGESIPREKSLYDFVRGRAVEEVVDDGERELLLQMSEMWGAYVGEPVWKQSLRFAWMEECCGGGRGSNIVDLCKLPLTMSRGDVRRVELFSDLGQNLETIKRTS